MLLMHLVYLHLKEVLLHQLQASVDHLFLEVDQRYFSIINNNIITSLQTLTVDS